MEDEFDFIVNYNTTIKAIRVHDNNLTPITWKLKCDINYRIDDEIENQDKYAVDVNFAFAKINYWFEHIVNGSLIFDRNNEWAQQAFFNSEGAYNTDNIMLITPGDPVDELICELFQAKMTALANGAIFVSTVELIPDDNNLSYVYFTNGKNDLPTIDEWLGELRFFDNPWWYRNDGSTIDTTPKDIEDAQILPKYAFSLDFLADQFSSKALRDVEIITPQFKPNIIDGGLNDRE